MDWPSYGFLGFLIIVLDIIAIGSVVAGHSTIERKLIWSIVILILPVVGMILYFAIGRSPRDAIV